jgi:hypothetical protein
MAPATWLRPWRGLSRCSSHPPFRHAETDLLIVGMAGGFVSPPLPRRTPQAMQVRDAEVRIRPSERSTVRMVSRSDVHPIWRLPMAKAAIMTRPLAMSCISMGTFNKPKPLFITPISSTPTAVMTTKPGPPIRLVPPDHGRCRLQRRRRSAGWPPTAFRALAASKRCCDARGGPQECSALANGLTSLVDLVPGDLAEVFHVCSGVRFRCLDDQPRHAAPVGHCRWSRLPSRLAAPGALGTSFHARQLARRVLRSMTHQWVLS